MLDVDEIRDMQIKIFDLVDADREYVFYHDETNNIKKLRIRSGSFNVAEPSVFVLGGVVHSGKKRELDLRSLRSAMGIQKSASEIKFKHIASGDFLSVLKSNKLNTFLCWLAENHLTIHYHSLDPVYWAIVDIIDSIIFGLDEPHLYTLAASLKADLTSLLRSDLNKAALLFERYNYPDLLPTNRRAFLNEILEILSENDSLLPELSSNRLRGLLQAGRNIPNLEFIEGFTPLELIQSFAMFYVNRIAVFKYASHIFDNEDSVQEDIDAMGLSSAHKPIGNYKFEDSILEPGIQLSDIIVGLIGKMHTWLVRTSVEEIITQRATLQGVALKNVELLRDLIDASHEANIGFLHHVMSTFDINKMNLFLRNRGSGYECYQDHAS